MSFLKELAHLKISLNEIKSATNDFCEEKFIGKGGFGVVYKGRLSHSKGRSVVAIKRLDCTSRQGEREFLTEIVMLSRYTHTNIAALVGFCDECDEKILVYEYASHRSLDRYLTSASLGWLQRLKICVGAARGLEYLHNPGGSQQRVLHRDIKSSNILLDENWKAKVSDFGLSRIGPANQQFTFLVTNAAGTPGFCDPQYMKTGILTKESDVFSFGVMLFEVLCGRKGYEEHFHDQRRFLVTMARHSYETNTVNEIICDNLREEIQPNSLDTFLSIAYRCLEEDRGDRPTMTEVVKELEIALGFQEETSHFSHDHPLVYTGATGSYECNGCHQKGYKTAYRCKFQGCNFFLHKECAMASMDTIVDHPFSTKCKLRFMGKTSNDSSLCDACGVKVNNFAYSCLCRFTKHHFHPVCLGLDKTLVVAYGMTFSLQKSATSECLRCEQKELKASVNGWAYVSPDEKLCYHALCVTAIMEEFRKNTWNSDPFEAIKLSFPVDLEKQQKKKTTKRKKMRRRVVKTLIGGVVALMIL